MPFTANVRIADHPAAVGVRGTKEHCDTLFRDATKVRQMTRADLTEEVCQAIEMPRKESDVVVCAIFDSIVRAVRSGDKVEIAGIAPVVNDLWMSQIARNLTDADDGVLAGKRYLIHDRDPLFTAEFLRTLDTTGVKSVKLPPRSPNLNAHAERFVRGIKESCLDRMIFFGEASLRTAIWNFVEHYHTERNHQGLSNRIIRPEEGHIGASGAIQRRQRLGGTLNYYYRAAA